MKSSLKLLKAKKRPPRKREVEAARATTGKVENADEAVTRLYALLDEASKASRTAIKKEAEEKKAEERFKYAQQHKAITKLPATKAKMWNEVLELRDEHTVLKTENFRMSETIARQERELAVAEERIATGSSTLAELREEVKELNQRLMDARRAAEGERREAAARLKEAGERAEEVLRALEEEKGGFGLGRLAACLETPQGCGSRCVSSLLSAHHRRSAAHLHSDAELAEVNDAANEERERLQKNIAGLEAENADWKRRHAKFRDLHADAELRLLEAKVRKS